MTIDQLIISNMQDGLLATDLNDCYISWNPMMEHMTGVKAQDVLGKNAFEIFPFLKENGTREAIQKSRSGEVSHTQKRPYIIPSSGKSGFYEGHYSALKNDKSEIIGCLGIIRDITKQVQAEEEAVTKNLQSILDEVPTIIWSSDGEGVNTFVNRYGLDYVGLNPGQTQFVDWLPLVHPEDLGSMVKSWEESFRKGLPYEHQHRLRRASDNTYRWILIRAQPVRDQSGKIVQWVGTITDIHDQVVASGRSFELQSITAALSGAVTPSQVADIILDKGRTALRGKNGVIAVLTHSQELEIISALGYPKNVTEQWRRIPMADSIPLTEAVKQRRLIFVENLEEARRRYPLIVDAMIEAKETAFIAIPLIIENRVIGALGISFDRLIKRNQEKESFLQTLGGLCSQAYERSRIYESELSARALAESANAAKTNLLANVSHEIRTPLASIIAYSELLMNDELTADRRKSFVEALNRNGQILVRLIDDILDLSKIESGRLSFEKVDFELRSFLAEIVEALRHEADRKGIKFEFKQANHIPTRVTTDPFRLRQILLNICNNAIKFTELGSVRVDLEFQDKTDVTPDQLIFTVVDTGVGLKADAHERLFKPFSQGLSAGTYKYRGTGLGLVISRNLARMLGGDVELISSTPGKGSVFQIRIACIAYSADSPISENQISSDQFADCLQGKKVLVAEDAPDLQELLSSILTKGGARVDVVENGEQAVRCARFNKYDLVIMDLQMPMMDGYQAASHLRREGMETPMIAITANALADQNKSYESGFDAHLIKPVSSERLLQTISDYVSL